MYVEKRRAGKKVKYYLAHSFREGGKVHKVRKFLGTDLSKKTLEESAAKAKESILAEINRYRIISDPLQTPLSEEEIEFVRNLELREKLRIFHLSEEQWTAFSESFTYNTNAIEGSELDRGEVKDLLGKNKWPNKSKDDIAEAFGVNEAVSYIRRTEEHLSISLIRKLHRIVFKNSKTFAGEFRSPGVEVVVVDGLGNVVHRGAPQARISSLLKELAGWYEKNRTKYPGLILAAVVHNQFENIHPFQDGNGRVGRLLLNNVLLRNGLPPVNIDFRNREEYYETLREYEGNHNLRPTIDLLLKEYRTLKKRFR
jgi:Fic family protein